MSIKLMKAIITTVIVMFFLVPVLSLIPLRNMIFSKNDVILPIFTMDRRVFARMSSNDRQIVVLVDTGSPRSLINKKSADALNAQHVRAAEREIMDFSGNKQSVDLRMLPSLRVGDHEFGPFRFLTVADGLSVENHTFDAILGMDITKGLDIELDLDGSIMILSRPGTCASNSSSKSVYIPFTPLDDVRFQIDIKVNGITLTAMIDTGATDTLVIESGSQLLGFNEQVLSFDRDVLLSGISNKSVISGKEHEINRLEIGPFLVKNKTLVVSRTAQASFDVILGFDVLSKFNMCLSRTAQGIWFESRDR